LALSLGHLIATQISFSVKSGQVTIFTWIIISLLVQQLNGVEKCAVLLGVNYVSFCKPGVNMIVFNKSD